MPLSTPAAAALRGVIDQSLAPAPAPSPAPPGAAGGGGLPSDFCTLWPHAEPILKTLATVVPAIPGIGKSAGPILTSLISVGDTVHKQTCASAAGAASTSPQAEARAVIEQSLAASPGAATGANFCSVWPEAKPILQLLSGIVFFIPGAGAAAAPILVSLIAVGDSVFQQTCPTA
jgi:hypothetical protein